MNTSEKLRALVLERNKTLWQRNYITSYEEFAIMRLDIIGGTYPRNKIVEQMWMLFFAEFFETGR